MSGTSPLFRLLPKKSLNSISHVTLKQRERGVGDRTLFSFLPKKGRICKLVFRMNQSSGDASIGARYLSDSLKKTRTTKPSWMPRVERVRVGRGRD